MFGLLEFFPRMHMMQRNKKKSDCPHTLKVLNIQNDLIDRFEELNKLLALWVKKISYSNKKHNHPIEVTWLLPKV